MPIPGTGGGCADAPPNCAICAALGALALGLSGSGQLYAFLLFFVVSGLGLFALTRRSRAIDADAYSDPALGRVDLPDRRG